MINPYWELVILLCLINIIFAISLNLILGYNGQFSLGHAGFLAIGAYTSGVVTTALIHHNPNHEVLLWHLGLGVVLAIVVSLIGAVIIGYPCLRLTGDYLAIATLGFAEIIRIVILALPKDLFGGATGMQNVKNLNTYINLPTNINGIGNFIFCILFFVIILGLGGWAIWAFSNLIQRTAERWIKWAYWRWAAIGSVIIVVLIFCRQIVAKLLGSARLPGIFEFHLSFSRQSFDSEQWVPFTFFLAAVVIVTLLTSNYLRSVPGRAVVAIREDEVAATNLGINCTWMKLQNFMLGSALAGLAGALLAHTLTLFKPTDFNFFKSVDVLLMVVLGGMGSITGSFVGATIITVLLEALRFLGEWRLVIYSLILILFMIFRPGGLLGTAEVGHLIKLRLRRLIRSSAEGSDA